MPVLGSARARRRAVWVAAFAAVVAATAAVIVLLPKGTPDEQTLRPGARVVSTPRTVKLTAERRRAIDDLLDRFIPAAVERHDPLRALPLVTDDFRAGVSRDDWSRGNLPVFPYSTRSDRFHDWRLNYSYPREVSVEVLLHPAPKEKLGPLAYTAVFKQVHSRWLIDSFVTSAAFAPTTKPSKVVAAPDFSPLAEGRGKAQLSTRWLLVPAGILVLIVLIPVGFGIARLRRSRRAWRTYHAR
jgi:hypothetical protein